MLSGQKVFEGELTYHHHMHMNGVEISESKKHFDTLRIVIKNKNYIKTTNKINFEKELFIDSLQRLYVIYDDQLSKSKKTTMFEDNLNFGKLYKRENSHFGPIVSTTITDTVYHFQHKDHMFKKLILERKYGFETYIYSEGDSLKLTDDRNLLRNIGEQIHPKEVAPIIDNAILFFYKLSPKKMNIFVEYRLIEIDRNEITESTFLIPKHKDAKGFKRENRKRSRFKFYELID